MDNTTNYNNLNFEFSVGGYISFGKNKKNKEYLNKIFKSLKYNLFNLFYKLDFERKIVNRLCIFNPLYIQIPVYCYKIIKLNLDKTDIIENNNISGNFFS